MKIGFIGCGYVFDHYMTTWTQHPGLKIAGVADRDAARAKTVGKYYDLHVYEDSEALLADPEVGIVANFTSIESHYEVSKAAMKAGKHVYSEKPLTQTMDEAHDLVRIARENGVRLSCAPSNALSATVQTLWKAVEDGAIGTPRIIYAEFDDNPVYLLEPDTWASRSGAPWPYLHEYEMGCTWEHVGYHLTWMCAIFGPVRSVTSFSKVVSPDKTSKALDPHDTPDFSVATLDFESGVVGRVTCSITAPADHEMRIIGNMGELSTDTYSDYFGPVRLEPFSGPGLKARNMRFLRHNPQLAALLGMGGRNLPLAESPAPGGTKIHKPTSWRKRQRGQQDKAIGLAELVDAIATDRPHFPSSEFTLHLTELTHAIQGAGPDGASQRLTTRFEPLALPDHTRKAAPDYANYRKLPLIPRLLGARLIQ